jgi:xanthine dehydrogenase accessory factor
MMREILGEVVAALAAHRPCVFCSLVETRGSTPQKAGAAMLVFPDGSQRGTLGGGCVEAEVKQRALQLLDDRRPELLTFLLDDNYGWDDGLICGGRMQIVAQPLGRASTLRDASDILATYFHQFRTLVESGQGCTEAVLTTAIENATTGARFLFDGQAQLRAALHHHSAPEILLRHLPDVQQRPRAHSINGVAYLPVLPRIRLLIVGGGHVGQAVGRLAAETDFEVWVIDDRETYASRERFPRAQRLIVGDIGRALQELRHEVTPSTYCIIVTRGHAHDEEALYHLAGTPAGYLGMIGSKRKIRLIFDDLRAKGISEEALARVHAPLGLEIGSQTVPEIAISIMAELIACRNVVPSGGASGRICATQARPLGPPREANGGQ